MQVLRNIIQNATEAFLENSVQDPMITIVCLYGDDRITISIHDNAGGIREDVIGKIFNPYFTTKSDFNGTGIGLYMSKMIVEKHLRGKLSAFNEKDGATFEVTIPY